MSNVYSVSLDGSTDAFSIADHSDFKPTGAFTVGGWIKSSSTGYQKIFSSYFSTATEKGILLDYMTDSSKANARILFGYGGGVVQATSRTGDGGSGRNLADGAWHFLVGTFDGTNLKIYVDGYLEDSVAGGGNVPAYNATNYVRVGCFSGDGSNSNFVAGNLDQVFIVNGTAWSQATIQSYLYQSIPSDATNLKALWKFENNNDDSTANAHDLTDIGTPTYQTDPAYSENTNTYSLDLEAGSSQYAEVASDLGITSGACTLELWYQPESTPSSGNAFRLVGKSDAGTDVTYGIRYHNNGGTPRLTFWRVREGVSIDEITYNVTLSNGTWYHIALVYDTTNLSGYLNTTLVAGPTAYSGSGSAGGGDFFNIGAWGPYTPEAADGKFDEVRVWNVGRSQAELQANYQTLIDPTSANLVFYGRMENNFVDLTSNANFLTPVNSPVFSTDVPFVGGTFFNRTFLTTNSKFLG